MRFAELFAGAGGMSLGLEAAGWHSAWHAEIADSPRAILTHHWPSVPLYGDVTTLDGRALTALHGPIDLLCGGSPCQDLSVAGKRAGMTEGSGTRSSLFFEQMRLWKETGADLCLWENVDGARSSNSGKDFGHVLRAFVGAAVPVPSNGWRRAGVAAGPGGVAAWRVLDARYFGVPQRRRRVFVLGTRTGRVDPGQVLSLAESLRGDTPQSREAGEGLADRADDCVAYAFGSHSGTADGGVSNASHASGGPAGMGISRDRAHTLTGRTQGVVSLQEVGKRTGKSTTDLRAGIGISDPNAPMYTLQAGAQHGVIAFGHQNSAAQGASASARCTPALDRSKVPAVLAFTTTQKPEASDIAPTLLQPSSSGGGQPLAICITGEVTHSLTSEGADAGEDGIGRGTPVVVGTLSTITCRSVGAQDAMGGHIVANAICAREAKGWEPEAAVGNGTVTHGIPRRLTPRECERLMGWEDDHTLVPDAKGKPLSDAARYKACGNGVASPVAEWIGERLRLALEAERAA